jgi:hypothetical protein
MTTATGGGAPALTLGDARSSLLKLWRWSFAPLAFVIVQTVVGKYGRTWPDMLEGILWTSALLGPLLGIMYGASHAIQSNSTRSRAACNVELYRHCYWLSAFLIFMVGATLVCEPWLIHWKVKELLALMNIILQPVLYWLSGMLIIFFLG